MSSSVISGNKYFEGIHDVTKPEDGNEAGAIIGSYECLGITTDRWCGKELQVKEHALADLRGGRREAGNM